MLPRIIATYLPQFHRVKENDMWWGAGFTEWTAVKAAKPLFDGHEQPRKPLNNNYYNLLDKKVMQWQANLMKEYTLDGLCFWHYWFEDGRKILEKPAENLLKWKEIDMPFCFCWANETWARTWSNVPNPNFWASEYEPQKKKNDDGILLKQNYGDEAQWENHFLYLLPFFKDRRYIKHEGKPVFMIFRPFLLTCITPMIKCWNRLAQKNGMPGIYLMGFNMDDTCSPYDANINESFGCYDGAAAPRKKVKGGSVQYISYDDIWKGVLNTPLMKKNADCMCCTVRYDTTPRFGANGVIVHGAAPEKFGGYLEQALAKSCHNNSPFLILNAWNEWAEGNYLEPDEKYKYEYLSMIKKAKKVDYDKNIFKVDNDVNEKVIFDLKKKMIRFKQRCYLLNEWMNLKLNKKNISLYFEKNKYKKIAIYGWGDLGKLLYKDLEGTIIDVMYIIDRKGAGISVDKTVYDIEVDVLPNVDVIVVTVLDQFAEIYDILKTKSKCNIISLDSVINGV
jgi:hypothetical protein